MLVRVLEVFVRCRGCLILSPLILKVHLRGLMYPNSILYFGDLYSTLYREYFWAEKIFTVLAPPEPQGILDSLAFELGFDIPGLLQISELGSGVFWCYRYGALEQYGSFRK